MSDVQLKKEEQDKQLENKEKKEEGQEVNDDDDDDDEPDEWDQRIIDTGCAAENDVLRDCYVAKHDWRQCTDEMKAFKDCWQQRGNNARTSTK